MPSAAARYRLLGPEAHALSIGYDIDFANAEILAGTNHNQDKLARHLQQIYRAGLLGDADGQALTAAQDVRSFVRLANTLGSEIQIDNQIASLFSSLQFGDALLSCPQRSGEGRFFAKGQCGWLRVQGQRTGLDATDDNSGFAERGWQIAAGGQLELDHDWNLGSALSLKQSRLQVHDSDASSSGYQLQFGVSAKRRFGATEVSGAVAIGHGRFDIERPFVSAPGVGGEQVLQLASAQARVAHLFDQGHWYWMPRVDLGIDSIRMRAYDETGSRGLSLQLDGQRKNFVNLQPAVEIGWEFGVHDVLIRPRVVIGMTRFLGNTTLSATGSLDRAGAAEPFITSTTIDRTRFDLALGADVFSAKAATVRVEAFASLSSHSSLYGGMFKLGVPF